MYTSYSKQALFAALLPLVYSIALPGLDSRDEVRNDVIRYMKCDKLFAVKDKGGWEQGMAGWYPDSGQTGAPKDRAVFEMYTDMEDTFFNGKGSVYGAEYYRGGGSIWADFSEPYLGPSPPTGIFVGTAKRTDGSQSFTYNCFADSWKDAFEYEDEKYGTCNSYASCVQKDALRIVAKGTEETTRAEDPALPVPADIYAKFRERYDADTGICDVSPIEISHHCSVKFECKNHDEPAVMDALIDNLQNFGESEAFKEEKEFHTLPCQPMGGGCPPGREVLYRTMPKVTQLIARGDPPPDSGRLGYEVASIKTTITCEESVLDKTLCTAFSSIFAIVGLVPQFLPVSVFGGVGVQAGCSIAGVD